MMFMAVLLGAGGVTGPFDLAVRIGNKMTPLTTWYTVSLNGGYVAAGCGMKYSPFSSISVTTVPVGSTVRRALLYWAVQCPPPEQAVFAQGNINGNPVTGIKIGTDVDPCWGQDTSWAYRADVTPFVSGNGIYNLSGFYNQGGTVPVATGASLFIIYENPMSPYVTVCVNEGNMDVPIGPLGYNAIYQITGFTALAPVTASLSISAQDGQISPDGPLYFNSVMINPNPVFEGRDPPIGNFWDTMTWDVSALVSDGATTATVWMTHPGSGDCVNLIASCFSTTSADPANESVDEKVSLPDNVLGLTPEGLSGRLRLISGLRQDIRLSVYEAGGRLVATRDMKGLEVGEYHADFSGLGRGVFMVVAESNLGARAGARMVVR